MNLKEKIYKTLTYPLLIEGKLNEINWGLVFNSAIKDSPWFIRQTLNPGRWAMGYPGLYILFRVLSEAKPENILEFGLGESSKLTFQYKEYYKGKELLIIEHDPEWLNIFDKNIFPIRDSVKILPIQNTGSEKNPHFEYENLLPGINKNNSKYDLIIVDGPWGSRRDSRCQIIDIVDQDLLADSFVILIDDSERKGENETIKKLCKLLTRKNIEYHKGVYYGTANTTIICSPNYRFFSSL